MQCKYCSKECKNNNSLINHERLCKQNPNRQSTPFQDISKQKEIIKKRKETGRINQWSNPDYQIKKDTVRKISRASTGKYHSKETKEKISSTIVKKVESNQWHTSLAKNHHYCYKGVDLHGKWELNYAKWLDSQSINWCRCKESFSYYYDGKYRRYTPDFYLIDSDEYIEIKGYKTNKDIAKWTHFPKYRKLVVLMKKELKDLGII